VQWGVEEHWHPLKINQLFQELTPGQLRNAEMYHSVLDGARSARIKIERDKKNKPTSKLQKTC